MQWVESNEVNWRQLLDDDLLVVVMIRRGEISDAVCGRVCLVNNLGELEVESLHQGRFGFYDHEVEKVLILGKPNYLTVDPEKVAITMRQQQESVEEELRQLENAKRVSHETMCRVINY
jgi:hypothetical protein